MADAVKGLMDRITNDDPETRGQQLWVMFALAMFLVATLNTPDGGAVHPPREKHIGPHELVDSRSHFNEMCVARHWQFAHAAASDPSAAAAAIAARFSRLLLVRAPAGADASSAPRAPARPPSAAELQEEWIS